MIEIRRERSEDIGKIFSVNESAFETDAEARVVDLIRENCPDTLSLVAEDDGEIVGHIFFSTAGIQWSGTLLQGMGLAPAAVLPDRQKQGIGSQLVKEGLQILKDQGCPWVIVLGHKWFYPKFGFEPASQYNLACQWEGIPEDVFMVRVFDPSSLLGVKGVARYRREFDEAM